MQPRLVVIAGPNGAGKTSLAGYLLKSGIDLGAYINPDDIARDFAGSYEAIGDEDTRAAQAEADRFRAEFLLRQLDHCFETVMSHPSKLEYMESAKALGFHVTLHFVGIESTDISILRVDGRVQAGGHSVPVKKIEDRYPRTMAFLARAIRTSDRAYVYDNSRAGPRRPKAAPYPLVAAYQNGICIERNDFPDLTWPTRYLP